MMRPRDASVANRLRLRSFICTLDRDKNEPKKFKNGGLPELTPVWTRSRSFICTLDRDKNEPKSSKMADCRN
jgi:hypothetical protein